MNHVLVPPPHAHRAHSRNRAEETRTGLRNGARAERHRPQVSFVHSDPGLSEALPGYEIGRMIGRGKYGIVYAGRQLALRRRVAIKQLWPDLMSDQDARRRFATEARLLASLDHRHIVRVHDYVEGGVCALVLERMRGGTLHERLAGGRIPARSACAIAVAALSGLEHAHRQGIVHRDVKPQNLLFADDGLIKLADFGLAKAIGPAAAQSTSTTQLAGTPAFMAPEQVDRALGPISPATDVWAVGAMLYEMLAGQHVMPQCDDIIATLLQRVSTEAPPLRRVAPNVPAALSDVVAKAMARCPAERFGSAGQFARGLRSAAEGLPWCHGDPHLPDL